MPPSGVLTPELLLTAVLLNDPVTGMEEKKEPTKLQMPSAIISCVASIRCPSAAGGGGGGQRRGGGQTGTDETDERGHINHCERKTKLEHTIQVITNMTRFVSINFIQ